MQPLYLVVAGDLSNGLKGKAILAETEAFALVGKLQVPHQVADALLIGAPVSYSPYRQDVNGKFIVLVGDVVPGLKAIGPFTTEDDAIDYGENSSRYVVVLVES